jgi:hypothetical protein
MTHAGGDTVEIAGLRVTVPERIVYDLAFLGDAVAADDAVRIIAASPWLADRCARRIRDARNLPGKGRALRRLAEWREPVGAPLSRR